MLLGVGWLLLAGSPGAEAPLSQPEERKVVLKGTRNTRDLGGLPVSDGRLIRGRIFRSGALCFASREDAEKLLGMGLRTLLELRLPAEIAKDGPDKPYLVSGVSRTLHWPMGNRRGLGQEAYISYMEDNGPLVADFFRLLSQSETYPLLFHCSAGKDRTGILAALLLDALGTPREIIYDDYLHSRRITPKLKVEKEWLEAVFEIVDGSGGIHAYLRKQGVSDEVLAAVRQHLVEPAQP